jgi:hypothetical protein
MNKSTNLNDACVMCGKYYTPEGEGMVCKQCQENTYIPKGPRNIHIKNSYNIWSTKIMWSIITKQSWFKYQDVKADRVLNRSFKGMYIEWYLHNIGYYLTLPFIKIPKILKLNQRFKHVDLEEH